MGRGRRRSLHASKFARGSVALWCVLLSIYFAVSSSEKGLGTVAADELDGGVVSDDAI